MINASIIFKQINCITENLILTGLCDKFNFPAIKQLRDNVEEVGISKHKLSSDVLKDIKYDELYTITNNAGNYNYRMIDGALISMHYRFCNKELLAHRLSFMPSPELHDFQNYPEIYLEDEIYVNIIEKGIVPFPLRFDFDKREGSCEPIRHPVSHLTVGGYKNCRIPVKSGLTPYQFISFLTHNFYSVEYKISERKAMHFDERFEETIFSEEMKLLHVSYS